MEDSLDVRGGLLRMRDECLVQLADLARRANRKEADRIYEQIQVLNHAILNAVQGGGSEMRYAKYKSAVAAIVAYLEDVDRPVPQRELIDALLKGGWRYGDDKAETNLKQAIGSFAHGLGRRTGTIKIVNDKVGLKDWENSRFKQ